MQVLESTVFIRIYKFILDTAGTPAVLYDRKKLRSLAFVFLHFFFYQNLCLT